QGSMGGAVLDTGRLMRNRDLDLGSNILGSVGVLEGRLEGDSASAAAGYIQIYGLERLARINSNGAFAFQDLPAGRFRLRAVSSLRGLAYAEPPPIALGPGDTVDAVIVPLTRFENEDYSRWAQARNIYLDAAAAGLADSLVDYPLLVRLHAGNFDFGATSGRDIRFADAEGRHLSYEIERWDAAAGKAEIWVKVPVVRGKGGAQRITLYWGNPDAPDFSSGRSVFGAYAGVWHLGRRVLGAGPAEYPDASPTAALGVASRAIPDEESAIGKGAALGGTQLILAPGLDAVRPHNGLALSGWIRTGKVDREGGEMVSSGNNYGLRLDWAGQPYFYMFDDSTYTDGKSGDGRWKTSIANGVDLRDNAWHHVAAVWDGAFMRVYVDGQEKDRTAAPNPPFFPFDKEIWMGRLGQQDITHDFSGLLDEVRISGEAWPKDKVKLDFESQKPGSLFLEFR
ncbi:MAG TPA: DUF2341 domain-containing protein, partial [Fibrobacteria bacterium]|nr:DUF2341 domain-containing protein [Fibrobacteria bacterium]